MYFAFTDICMSKELRVRSKLQDNFSIEINNNKWETNK